MYRRRTETSLVTLVLLLTLAACSHQERVAGGSQCIDLSDVIAERLMEQQAVTALSRDVQADLIKSLETEGQLCLTAGAVAVSCNAGDARAPDVRRCCKFSQTPQAAVSGIPTRLVLRHDTDPEARPAVELNLRGVVADLALDQRCEVPTCAADRASARPQLEVSGYLTNERGIVEIALRIDLGRDLELTCELPDASAGAT